MTPRENYLKQADYCRVMAEQARTDEVRESYLTAREGWLKLAESEESLWAIHTRTEGPRRGGPEAF